MEEFAIIILNYNSAEDTVRCAKQLSNFNLKFHIIVVDNDSTDDSMEIIEKNLKGLPYIDVICTGYNGGYGAGNNFGIKYAMEHYSIDYIGVINPDVIIPNASVIERMLEVMSHNNKIGVIGASVIDFKNMYNPNKSGRNIPTPKEIVLNQSLLYNKNSKIHSFKLIEDGVAQIDCVAGCFFIARVSAMESIGFFDENIFLYNEENVLGIKMKKAGYIGCIVLDQFYIHAHNPKKESSITFKKKILSTQNSYDSRKYLCKTYYSPKLLPLLWLVEMMNRLYLTVAYFKSKLFKS